jgi:hypothetical protein
VSINQGIVFADGVVLVDPEYVKDGKKGDLI